MNRFSNCYGFLERQEPMETPSSVRDNHEMFAAQNVIDGDDNTYWTIGDQQLTGYFEIELDREALVDAIVVQEYVALGQRIGGQSDV